MSAKGVGEALERALQEGDRPIGMAARAAAPELATPADDPLEILSLRRPRGEPPGRTGDRCQSEDARSALARALRGEVGHDAGGCLHPTPPDPEAMHAPAPPL